MKLTKDKILKIPKMKAKGMTNEQIAQEFGVTLRTIASWVPRLREAGHEVPRLTKKPLNLKK